MNNVTAFQTITIPGRDLVAGDLLHTDCEPRLVLNVKDECTIFHGSKGRVAMLSDESEYHFHADLDVRVITRFTECERGWFNDMVASGMSIESILPMMGR